jgi:serine/threonine protein phosphatase 1
MFSLLSRVRKKLAPDAPAAITPAPDQPFIAVGDIHGRADLLHALQKMIAERFPGWPVVFLGDYIDRGEDSRAVLDDLRACAPDRAGRITCLMGNHERMLLDFIDDPALAAPTWLANGGLQTLLSFGVRPPRGGSPTPDAAATLRDNLCDAIGPARLNWLRQRPLSWHNGNVWAAHAGVDPRVPLSQQTQDTLLWGHPAFARIPNAAGALVVHGHTIVRTPVLSDGRVAIDTGAYATGRLTAAAIMQGAVEFFQTGSG